ncbi:MAG TPA: DUF4394 domain-containing protein [Acidimicrobiales bacterium]|nr:DUF4394 domain-containing protein [Acidimicrobiales bacterium]
MKPYLKTALAASAVAVSLVLPASGAGAQASGTTLYGLTTTNRIVTLNTAFPVFASANVAVTGLAAGEQLIGIDRRPKTGVIYGVGKLGTAGRLFTIDPATGAATFVANLVTAPAAPGGPRTPIALSGTEFGFDFNPVPDALRIVSDTGQNLRVIPSDRMPAAVALLAGDTFTDSPLNVAGTTATGISAAAYTGNDNDPATGTVLYDIDTRRDLLVKQDPPNSGTLVTVGSLRFPAGPVAGFDILTANGVDTAFAAITVPGGRPLTLLSRIDLATGQAKVTNVAAFPQTLRGIAF